MENCSATSGALGDRGGGRVGGNRPALCRVEQASGVGDDISQIEIIGDFNFFIGIETNWIIDLVTNWLLVKSKSFPVLWNDIY